MTRSESVFFGGMMGNTIICDSCSNYVFDEDEEEYICVQRMDEDDFYRIHTGGYRSCPYYILDDEYRIVRHQM